MIVFPKSYKYLWYEILRHKYQTAVNARFHYVQGLRFFRNHFYQVWLAPFVVEPWICREYLISFHTAPQ